MNVLDQIREAGRRAGRDCSEPTVEQMRRVGQAIGTGRQEVAA